MTSIIMIRSAPITDPITIPAISPAESPSSSVGLVVGVTVAVGVIDGSSSSMLSIGKPAAAYLELDA